MMGMMLEGRLVGQCNVLHVTITNVVCATEKSEDESVNVRRIEKRRKMQSGGHAAAPGMMLPVPSWPVENLGVEVESRLSAAKQ